ncbi:hypothetical protein H4219_004748 [Mycoemilia scoparia]|uniref:Uncharacterized protein n=1 Tax=Mycoemilia scoparia TaxID=417184 RepID=A0A9W7ZQM0_9FUNG|nr:hypothetical protein H4219_004748 [Mycoemilia scoparia]
MISQSSHRHSYSFAEDARDGGLGISLNKCDIASNVHNDQRHNSTVVDHEIECTGFNYFGTKPSQFSRTATNKSYKNGHRQLSNSESATKDDERNCAANIYQAQQQPMQPKSWSHSPRTSQCYSFFVNPALTQNPNDQMANDYPPQNSNPTLVSHNNSLAITTTASLINDDISDSDDDNTLFEMEFADDEPSSGSIGNGSSSSMLTKDESTLYHYETRWGFPTRYRSPTAAAAAAANSLSKGHLPNNSSKSATNDLSSPTYFYNQFDGEVPFTLEPPPYFVLNNSYSPNSTDSSSSSSPSYFSHSKSSLSMSSLSLNDNYNTSYFEDLESPTTTTTTTTTDMSNNYSDFYSLSNRNSSSNIVDTIQQNINSPLAHMSSKSKTPPSPASNLASPATYKNSRNSYYYNQYYQHTKLSVVDLHQLHCARKKRNRKLWALASSKTLDEDDDLF